MDFASDLSPISGAGPRSAALVAQKRAGLARRKQPPAEKNGPSPAACLRPLPASARARAEPPRRACAGPANFRTKIAKNCGVPSPGWCNVIVFLDRTVAARRYEKSGVSTAGMIPGDRGMGRNSWCCVSPAKPADKTARGQAYITSSSGRSRVRPVHESGTERRGAIRNRAEPSQVHGMFRPVG